MTPAQLEAHRVQFEAAYAREHLLSFAEELKKYRCLNLPDYVTAKMSNAWQAYQWGIADADAQRADLPPLPDDFSESKDWKAGGYAERVQWLLDMVSAQRAAPGVQVDGIHVTEEMHRAAVKVLHRAHGVDGLPQEMMAAMLAAAPAHPPQQSAQPVAVASDADWLYVKLMDWCRKTGRAPANENKLFAIVEELRKLLAAAQPVEAANGWEKGLDIRMSQGWKLKGGICPVLYTDTVNGYGVGRDDLWLATTEALKSAQPVEVQPDRVPLPKIVEQARAMALVSTNWLQAHAPQELKAQSVQRVPLTDELHAFLDAAAGEGLILGNVNAAELYMAAFPDRYAAHGIKPTSSEGGKHE